MYYLKTLKTLSEEIDNILGLKQGGLLGTCSIHITHRKVSINVPYVSFTTKHVQQISELFETEGCVVADGKGGLVIEFDITNDALKEVEHDEQ